MISDQMRATDSTTTAGWDRVRVLLVSLHPVRYGAPIYRLYSADPRLDMTGTPLMCERFARVDLEIADCWRGQS